MYYDALKKASRSKFENGDFKQIVLPTLYFPVNKDLKHHLLRLYFIRQ